MWECRVGYEEKGHCAWTMRWTRESGGAEATATPCHKRLAEEEGDEELTDGFYPCLVNGDTFSNPAKVRESIKTGGRSI